MQIDSSQFQDIIDNEKLKHAHWVSIDHEFLRFTPVIKPFFIANHDPEEQSSARIEFVFKEIPIDTSSTSLVQDNGSINGRTSTKRRKFRRKRRTMPIKARLSAKSTSLSTTIPDVDGEHSQEYVARRPRIDIEESTGESSSIISSHLNSPIDVKPNPENSQLDSQSINVIDRVENNPTDESSNSNFRQVNEDSFKRQFTSPLPFKKRAWNSALIDPSVTSNV